MYLIREQDKDFSALIHITNDIVRSRIENIATIISNILDIDETCQYLGIGKTKARELIRGHNGFGIQIGNRWYADKKKLDIWIERNTI